MAGINDVAKYVAKNNGISAEKAKAVLEAGFKTIIDITSNDEDVRIAGFGTFKKNTKAARTGRNPRTGESVDIPEKDVMAYKPAKDIFPKKEVKKRRR